ncbi:MAG TPA: hypothetical protein VLP43_05975 [Solirubrobacteraceae bacterium]|nr:hypothetical protein [Solirubrobacteraceae bacterium]
MSREDSTRDELVVEGWHAESVIAVSFEVDDQAYAALTLLGELDSQRQVRIQEAVVAIRYEDGQVVEKERVESTSEPSALGGGLVGLVLGIIGGPFGMLIGGMSGVFIGSVFDMRDLDDTESALSAISRSASVGHPTLLAVVAEQSPEVIDAAMAGVGGTVLRRSVFDVAAEIAAAKKAERKAKRTAREELVRARRRDEREAAHAKVERLGPA